MREVHSLVWFFKERRGSIWWCWLTHCLLPLPARLFSSFKAVQRIHTCTHTHMLLSLLRCLNDCSGQQLPSQSQGKLVFHQQALWEASGLPHCCFGFCYFFLFSSRKLLKTRSPAPHSAFQNYFKCTLLGWNSCFSLLRKKKRERERQRVLLLPFFPPYRLSFQRHTRFHFWPRFHSRKTTSVLPPAASKPHSAEFPFHMKGLQSLRHYLCFPLQ